MYSMSFLYLVSGKYADSYTLIQAKQVLPGSLAKKTKVFIPETNQEATLPKTSLWTTRQLQTITQKLNVILATPLDKIQETTYDCSNKKYLIVKKSSQSPLTKKEQKYCRCLLHVLSKKIKNPYGICQSSVRPDSGRVIPCFTNYHFRWILSCQGEEFRKFYLSKNFPVWIFPLSLQNKFRYPSRFKRLSRRDKALIWAVLDFLKTSGK